MNHRIPIYNLYHFRSRLWPMPSQRAFAKKARLTLGTYGNLERGHTRCVSEATLRRLARAYGVRPEQLRHPLQEHA